MRKIIGYLLIVLSLVSLLNDLRLSRKDLWLRFINY